MSETDQNRRQFLVKGLTRALVLGAMAVGIGTLVAKRRETCISDGVCRDCGTLSECGLPQALSFKRVKK